MPVDPYAEFGGSVKPPADSVDPYAAFGGSVRPSATISLTPTNPSGSVANFASNAVRALNPIPGIKAIATDPQGIKHGIEQNIFQPQAEQFSKANEATHGRGEFSGMTPIERASSAVGHAAAGALPLVGPAAANAGDQIGSGDVSGGLGSAAGLIGSMAVPEVVHGVGKGLRRTAEPLAESALGIRGADRAYGRTPGRSALDETSGFRPETVEASAQAKLNEINAELEALAHASKRMVDLGAARDVMKARMAKAASGNSSEAPKELQPMLDHLTEPQPGFQGATSPIHQPAPGAHGPSGPVKISDLQNPETVLRMKREFSEDHANWNPGAASNRERGTAKQAAHQLADDLHTALPEGAALDKRSTSLIPVAQRSKAVALNAGVGQNILSRVAKQTGGLALAAVGYHEGGIPGAILGAALPEVISAPAVKMAGARGLNAAGKVLKSPIVGRTVQAGTLIHPGNDPLDLSQFIDQQ